MVAVVQQMVPSMHWMVAVVQQMVPSVHWMVAVVQQMVAMANCHLQNGITF